MSDKVELSPDEQARKQRLAIFVASCISLVATAMTFAIRGAILDDLKADFKLDDTQLGWVGGAWAWGFAGAILIGGPLCDTLKMGRIMMLAFIAHVAGVIVTIAAISLDTSIQFSVLFIATLTVGIGNGLVEAAINPLVATLYPKKKVGMLNILHAWFPGGIVIGGLASYGINEAGINGLDLGALSLSQWQLKMAILLVPMVVYGAMFALLKLPETERVQSGVSTAGMWKEAIRPAFILLVLCMMMTAATELGPNTWITPITERSIEGMAAAGILVLVWINLIMAIARFFAGPIAHAISPPGMVTICAALAGIGVFLMSTADSAFTSFAYAAIFAIGVSFFWPTMLGMTSERFPRGGALLLGIMGAMGNVGVALITPGMGAIVDATGDPQAALKYIAILPAILVLVFGGIYLWDRSQGGYRIVELDTPAGEGGGLVGSGVETPEEAPE